MGWGAPLGTPADKAGAMAPVLLFRDDLSAKCESVSLQQDFDAESDFSDPEAPGRTQSVTSITFARQQIPGELPLSLLSRPAVTVVVALA